MTAQPHDIPPAIVVDTEPVKDVKELEERLAHYHPEHHHFYETKHHVGKRIGRIVIAGTGFMADSYDLLYVYVNCACICDVLPP